MGANKKPRHAYRAKWNSGGTKLRSQPWKIAAVFNPLTAIIDQLEQHGTNDVAADGTAVFKDALDGTWYDSSVAILGTVEAYEIHERRHQRALGLEPLRRLAKMLEYGMPITGTDTATARACLERMRGETVEMTSDYAKQLIKDFQIMEELQKVAA
jgi:hypothetical protein